MDDAAVAVGAAWDLPTPRGASPGGADDPDTCGRVRCRVIPAAVGDTAIRDRGAGVAVDGVARDCEVFRVVRHDDIDSVAQRRAAVGAETVAVGDVVREDSTRAERRGDHDPGGRIPADGVAPWWPTVTRSPKTLTGWGICGGSSGGNCAFTAAWLCPDRFRRVIGFLSSFAQMPGGNPYPNLITSCARKPLRIFLQAGHRDLHWNEHERNWLADNLRVAAALAEAGYDFHLVVGDGGHNANHGGVLLPDALRWLWRSAEAS